VRLLVTGGAGFIGSAIVEAALAQGHDVRVLDSLRSDVHGGDPAIPAGVEFVRGDVRDADLVTNALDGVDVVCHQAAKVGLGVDFSDAPDYVSSNEFGTAVLLAGMARTGVRRFVQASSMVVYGEGAYLGANGPTRPAARLQADLDAGHFDPLDDDGQPLEPALITEDAPLDPRNVYAISKLSQEYLATSWARTTGGVAASLRYHNVYGPGMPQNTPYAGVASLFRSSLERGEAPRVFEDGRQRRDFVHSRDVAAANLAAIDWTGRDWTGRDRTSRDLTARAQSHRAFNVGSGTVHTIGEIAQQLSEHSGGPAPIVTGEYRLGDVRHITASSDRLKSELGWAPTMTFEAGMREFATAKLRAAVK